MMRMTVSRSARLAFVAAIAGLTGACSSLGSLDPGNLLASAAGSQAPAPGSAGADTEIDCPTIEVQDGTAALRVGGQDNSSVRYQFDIANTARECHIAGAQFSIKVGVAGHLLIGPAGTPGAYSAQLRIVVRHDADQKPVFSQLYKIDADTSGGEQQPFQFISDPIMLPLTTEHEDAEYTILVGFDNGAVEKAPKAPRRKKHTN